MQETDKAYIGGIFDGGGCISIAKHGVNNNGNKISYQPYIEISNKNENVLKHIHQFFSSTFFYKKKGDIPYPCLQITGQENLILFLESILPYLIIKKKRAELILKFCKSRYKNFRKAKSERIYTQDELKIVHKIKEMNKK